jgi:hypothetical protein
LDVARSSLIEWRGAGLKCGPLPIDQWGWVASMEMVYGFDLIRGFAPTSG